MHFQDGNAACHVRQFYRDAAVKAAGAQKGRVQHLGTVCRGQDHHAEQRVDRTLELGETYAMALAELGQFREAQSLQRDLIAASTRAGMTAMTARLQDRLRLYDRADPCRTPWTDEEMP